jgi:ElaB/YqjD/DUF883 family membrane-anchored ribosome-binding protein
VTDRIKEKVTGMGQSMSGTGHSAKDSVSGTAHAASDQVAQKAYRAKGLAESNPLGLAVGAIAAGFLAGLAVPVSQKEQEHLGPVADKARDKVREVTQEVGERAKEVAHATEDAVKEQVHS